jgi:hypothetical protein
LIRSRSCLRSSLEGGISDPTPLFLPAEDNDDTIFFTKAADVPGGSAPTAF